MTKQDIERQKKRLFKMYLRALISKKELMFYLSKLDEPLTK